MQTFWQDLKYGLRMLTKSPGFAAIVILTLALGIGANTAMFSVVNAVLFRPLPFKNPAQLVDVWRYNLKRGIPQDEMSYPDFLDLKAQNTVFDGVAAFRERHSIVFMGQEGPQRLHGTVASADLLNMLGVPPALGRTFLPGEDQLGAANVVMLGHEFWQTQFHADLRIVGRSIALEGGNYTVIGVMPRGFDFPISSEPVQVWLPVAADRKMAQQRGVAIYDVVARLKPGATAAQATSQVNAIYSRLAAQYPDNHTPGGAMRAVPALADLVHDSHDALLVLFAGVGVVLLIACVNVANLILARGGIRQREIAVRAALGGTRVRIVRQLFTENLLLASLGGGLGLACAYWTIQLLIGAAPPDIPRFAEAGLDTRVFLFALGASLLTSVLFGLVPAFRISKLELSEALKERGESATASRSRLRNVLIVSEVALSLVTVLGAGLLVQTLWRLERAQTGFDPRNVVTFNLDLPDGVADTQRVIFYQDLLPRLRALPGVTSASAIFPLPFMSGMGITTMFEIQGRPADNNTMPRADLAAIDRDYFRTMHIPIFRGQDLAEINVAQKKPVALINEAFARAYFPHEDPIGKRLKPDAETAHTPAQLAEIIGVVADAKTSSLREQAAPLVYVPMAQLPIGAMSVVMRTENDPRALMAVVRETVQSVDKNALIFSGRTLDQYIAVTLGQPRFNALLLGVFGGLALVLAMVGLYGAVSYAVSRRTHEIGIRMALGASPSLVLKLVLTGGLKLTLIGAAAGVAAALALSQVMTSLLFGVSATDPWTFLTVTILLMLVALAACYVPARRAMRVDPMIALRYE